MIKGVSRIASKVSDNLKPIKILINSRIIITINDKSNVTALGLLTNLYLMVYSTDGTTKGEYLIEML